MLDGRQRALWDDAVRIFDEDLADHVLTFNSHAADKYAEFAASRSEAGKAMSPAIQLARPVAKPLRQPP